MPQNVTWNGVTYPIPLAGELNWSSLSTFLIDLGTYAAVAQEGKQTVRVAVSSPVTVSAATDYAVITDLTVAGAVAVTLPAGVPGQIFIIVDGKGDALTNNITITPNGAETIGGASTLVLNKNRQSVILGYDLGTTDWKLLEYSIPVGGVSPSDLTLVTPSKGGTGVANNDAATMTRSGNFDLNLTLSGATGVTLPTTGTLATLAGTESLTNKTLDNTSTATGINIATITNTGVVTLPTATTTLVGRDTSDVLTNKDYDGGTASNTSRLTSPSDTLANLTALTRKAGTLVYATDTNLEYLDDGTSLIPFAAATPLNANIRPSEGGGTTMLVNSDNHFQVFNLSSDQIVRFPTTGVLAGDVWTIENQSPFRLYIQSSDTSTLVIGYVSRVEAIALVNTPVTGSDWVVTSVNIDPSSYSRYFVGVGSGSASTNTAIMTFSTVFDSFGTDITYTPSPLAGDAFTINQPGVYSISHTNLFTTSAHVGISRNSTQLSTGIESITDSDALTMSVTQANDYTMNVGATLFLNTGDVIRPHCGAGLANSASFNRAKFIIQRVA